MNSINPVEVAAKISANIAKVIVGKDTIIELALVALGCEGHLLLEDVPGVGKTMLARALAVSLGLGFNRVQCTPDLLPSDVTGMMIFNPKECDFQLKPGPLMANVVLVDEINRATPRTQSCLLEAMEEHQVTIDGTTRPLAEPFLVLATENPVEFEGTFPLPEAQLDRFMMRIAPGYPDPQQEVELLNRLKEEHPIKGLTQVVTGEEVQTLIRAKQAVFVEPSLASYIVELVNRTRNHPELDLGASPRGSIALFQASRVLAVLRGREFVIPEDIKYLAPYVLSHRVMLAAEAGVRGKDGRRIIEEIIATVPAPTEEAFHE